MKSYCIIVLAIDEHFSSGYSVSGRKYLTKFIVHTSNMAIFIPKNCFYQVCWSCLKHSRSADIQACICGVET